MVWDHEAGGSNPLAPTISFNVKDWKIEDSLFELLRYPTTEWLSLIDSTDQAEFILCLFAFGLQSLPYVHSPRLGPERV